MFQGLSDRHTALEEQLFSKGKEYFEGSPLPTEVKLSNFPKYVRRQDLSRFLAKCSLFEKQVEVPGVVVECGSFVGGGLFTFAQCSAISEPYNHTRKIYSFDTFEGFPAVGGEDGNPVAEAKQGDLATHPDVLREIRQGIALFDANRPLSHIAKIELVVGDAMETIPSFIESHRHVVVSLLYLDFDLYAPTRVALENFVPRMPKGAVLAFDELNCPNYPGETLALLDTLGVRGLALRKTTFDPWISYAVL